MLLHARERRREQETFTYDLELLSCDGCVLERWIGLRLRAVEDLKRTTAWPVALLSPWLERKAEECMPGAEISVALEAAVERVAERAGGNGGAVPTSPRAAAMHGSLHWWVVAARLVELARAIATTAEQSHRHDAADWWGLTRRHLQAVLL